ncbi:alpha/beta fold hydrolase, partial [Streptomyces smyrnaeus]|uniref:alpha/beta fold hydrolase n=1 Tax=Streptomyces smyrnaeus TaxID=1387713 RepID=UPI0033C1052A
WHPTPHRPRRAAISSFGASGTNAHLILQEPPNDTHDNTNTAATSSTTRTSTTLRASTCTSTSTSTEPETETETDTPIVWPLSAKTPTALTAQAQRLHHWLTQNPHHHPTHIAHTLTTRTQHPHRTTLIGHNHTQLTTALTHLTTKQPSPHVVPPARVRPGRIAFVVPAPRAQSLESVRGLLRSAGSAPAFVEQLERCAEALAPHTDWNLLEAVTDPAQAPALDRPEVFAPVLFAVQVSLAALWRAFGVQPEAVLAEPGGEPAASVIDGSRSLAEAARAVTGRVPEGDGGGDEPLKAAVGERVAQGFRAFVEISPQPSLSGAVTAALASTDCEPDEVHVTPPLAEGVEEADGFWRTLAEANVGGVRVEWSVLYAGRDTPRVELPTYAFQRQRYWFTETDSKPAAPAPRSEDEHDRRSGAFTTLLRRAHIEGTISDAVPVITGASRFRPSFTTVAELGEAAGSVLVADGAADPAVVCVPSFLAGSGPHQFALLASEFTPRLPVSALVLPGFGKSQPLPASWQVAVEAMARSALQAAAGRPLALVGHSVGGLVAQAITEQLESTGHRVEGVVMIDTYDIDKAEEREALFVWAMSEILHRDPTGLVVNDDNLMAMGAYLRLYEEWAPRGIEAPTLAVRATDPDAELNAPIDPTWKAADFAESLPADHFSVLESKAPLAARVLGDWFARLSDDNDSTRAAGPEHR